MIYLFPKDPQHKVEVDDWETLEDPHAKNHPKSSAEPKPKHKGKVKDYSFQLPVRRRLMRKNIKLTFMIILTEVQYYLGFYQSILSVYAAG